MGSHYALCVMMHLNHERSRACYANRVGEAVCMTFQVGFVEAGAKVIMDRWPKVSNVQACKHASVQQPEVELSMHQEQP